MTRQPVAPADRPPGSGRRSLRLLAPRHWATWIGIGLLRLVEPLPYPLQVRLGRAIGWCLGRLAIAHRRIARRNIELCLPEMAPVERERVLDRHFESLGVTLFETAITWWSADERVRRLCHVEGLEHLERALAAGRGVLILSAHFTTLEIGARALGAVVPLNIMYKPTRNELLSEFLGRNRGRHARRAIPRDDIRTLITALKANEPVWYAPDQAYRRKGAELVPFFGIPAATNTATSRLAKMTGAAVLPYFCERLPGSAGYRAVIQPALENFPSDDPAADTARFNALIEAQVRKVPEQYLWIHRRFKGLDAGYPDYYRQDVPGE